MVAIDVDSKHGSLASQALDMMLKLVAPEYSHKMWNNYTEFIEFLRRNNVDKVLFSYKDKRFGCLSRPGLQLFCSLTWKG